jgi:anaerobic magnesium-protoporphyrin IX monomethyl ester cyclase
MQKKILLINPPTWDMIRTNVPGMQQKQVGFVPPLGLLYIASYLRAFTQHKVYFLDCEAEELSYRQIGARIREAMPDILGITALSFNYLTALNVARIAKTISHNIKVVMGGPHPSIYPKETLLSPYVDYVIVGEGEKTFPELISRIGDGEYLLKGFLTQEPHIGDLDSLPFPARELLNLDLYSSVLSTHRKPFTSIITSRGCPYKCTFCDRPQIWKGIRLRSAENVINEIEECLNLGIAEFHFYDDTFAIDKKRILAICEGINNRDLRIYWHARTRVDTMDDELLRAMKDAGCQSIHYGIESSTPRILTLLKKNISLKKAEEIIRKTKSMGIQTLTYFILGNPTETREEIEYTINYAIKLKPDLAHFSILIPFPATEIYNNGLRDGVITNDYWRKFAASPDKNFRPPILPGTISEKELIALHRTAYRKFYFRLSYIFQLFKSVRTLGGFLRLVRGALRLSRSFLFSA